MDRNVIKLGGAALMAGAVIGVVFNLLHPRSRGALDSVVAEMRMVATSDIWLLDHFMLFVALALGLVGAVVVASTFPSMGWRYIALGAALSGGIFGLVLLVLDGPAMKGVADSWYAVSGDARQFPLASGAALTEVSTALFIGLTAVQFGLAPVLIGSAVLATKAYDAWLGYLGVGVGILGLIVATIEYFSGLSEFVTLAMFPIVSVAFTVWLFLFGWKLWQSARVPATAVSPAT